MMPTGHTASYMLATPGRVRQFRETWPGLGAAHGRMGGEAWVPRILVSKRLKDVISWLISVHCVAHRCALVMCARAPRLLGPQHSTLSRSGESLDLESL
jgi:hypothetical protein